MSIWDTLWNIPSSSIVKSMESWFFLEPLWGKLGSSGVPGVSTAGNLLSAIPKPTVKKKTVKKKTTKKKTVKRK